MYRNRHCIHIYHLGLTNDCKHKTTRKFLSIYGSVKNMSIVFLLLTFRITRIPRCCGIL